MSSTAGWEASHAGGGSLQRCAWRWLGDWEVLAAQSQPTLNQRIGRPKASLCPKDRPEGRGLPSYISWCRPPSTGEVGLNPVRPPVRRTAVPSVIFELVATYQYEILCILVSSNISVLVIFVYRRIQKFDNQILHARTLHHWLHKECYFFSRLMGENPHRLLHSLESSLVVHVLTTDGGDTRGEKTMKKHEKKRLETKGKH